MYLRFASLEAGDWKFVTSSADPQMNNYEGSVAINTNPESDKNGYLIGKGKKWYWSNSQKVTVPQIAMAKPLSAYAEEAVQDADVNEFFGKSWIQWPSRAEYQHGVVRVGARHVRL